MDAGARDAASEGDLHPLAVRVRVTLDMMTAAGVVGGQVS